MRPTNRRRSRSLRIAATRLGLVLGWGLALTAGLAILDLAQAADPEPATDEIANAEIARLQSALEGTRGDLAVKQLEIDRLKLVSQYSTIYKVPANVAGLVYDAALAEEIHPSLGFQLVKVESGFKPKARSSANAIGYAQVKLSTARDIDSTLTEAQLFEPETNLRIGFRVLRTLLKQFDQDLELALRAYNLGPTGALASLADTTEAAAGAAYARRVMKGVKRATVDAVKTGS